MKNRKWILSVCLVLALTMILNFVLGYLYQRFVVYRGMIDTNDVAKRAMEKEAAQAAQTAQADETITAE